MPRANELDSIASSCTNKSADESRPALRTRVGRINIGRNLSSSDAFSARDAKPCTRNGYETFVRDRFPASTTQHGLVPVVLGIVESGVVGRACGWLNGESNLFT